MKNQCTFATLILSCLALGNSPLLALEGAAVFNEIQYHPVTSGSPEWIELRNLLSVDVELSGWKMSGGVDFTFPSGSVIKSGGYVVISANPSQLQTESGITGVFGPWTGTLSNSGDTIRLRDLSGRLMDELTYNDRGPWPAGADGSGSTLARKNGHIPAQTASGWSLSTLTGGSPGKDNFADILGTAQTLFAMDAPWLFQDTSAGLANNWSQTSYTSGTGGWSSGNGVLAFEDAILPQTVNTILATPAMHPTGTYYFQKQFTFNGTPATTKLTLNALLDDGGVLYLNGHEIARRGMPTGAITSTTPASSEVANAEQITINIPTTHLIPGTNSLSVEVHQAGRPLAFLPPAGLSLISSSGSILIPNYATQPGATPFAKDVIPGYPATHNIQFINNGTYGNASSWIGNSNNSFCGVSFGSTPVSLGTVAWGRDNTGTFSDRCGGTYTLEYTTVPNPNVGTTAWTVIGSVTYPANGPEFATRHLFTFPTVNATGIRLTVPGNGGDSGACVDELEAGPPLSQNLKLMNTGGLMQSAQNLALGATPFAKDVIPGFPSIHNILFLNDGLYGNSNSWIGNSASSFAGISLATAQQIGRIAWGRDNTGVFLDRSEGLYVIQATTVANPTAATPDSAWMTVASVVMDASVGSPALRHLLEFPTFTATGIRVLTPAGACIDELELYAPVAPDVVWGASLIAQDILPPPSATSMVINEIGGAGDTVWKMELRNSGSTPLDLTGLIIVSSDSPLAGYTFPNQTLAAGDLIVLDETMLGFRPPLDGRIFLYSPGRTGVIDTALIRATPRARHGSGSLLTPTTSTFGSANQFTLADSIVISEVMYHFPNSDEEWIEIYNRGASAIDLSGWQLSDAVTFTFPNGTTIPAGGRLVVSNNSAALQIKWPGVAPIIIGDFSGSLSNSGERILLEDALGNPADELTYVDGGKWSELADGGGSSLELIDSAGDNAHPASWAASDESSKSTWQSFTWRLTATQPFGPSFWNELRLGLLDSGTCLIDDIRVTRDPDGVAQQLIPNGTFADLSAWRVLGNHGGSATITDGAHGSVLRLAATGPAETNHNHAETTFTGNTALIDGQIYEVSLRARWLGGVNKLGVRGYYSRIAKTLDLPIPQQLGTPGTANSRAGIAGPSLSALSHAPVMPTANQSVEIRCLVADLRPITNVTLFYRTSGGFTPVTMANTSGTWTGSIPGQPAATVVHFYVEATNGAGGVSHLPANGANSRALYIVDDGQRSTVPAAELRLVMMSNDSTTMLQPLKLLSNATQGGTLIANGKDVFYDIGIRLQGSAAGRARDGTDYQGFNVELNADEPYLGIYRSIGFDRSGRAPANRRQDEIYAKHLFHSAGLPCTRDDLAWLIGPTATYSGGAILQLNGYNGTFADDQFGDNSGNIYNFDGTYEPTTTIDGNVQSLKNPIPFTHHMTDLTDLGDDKEHYRGPFDIRVGKSGDDYTGLIAMCKSMALSGQPFNEQTAALIETDQWMRATALASLLGVADSWYTGGFPHNARFFIPTTGKAVALPWDMDFMLATSTNAPLNMTTGNLNKLTNVPTNKRAYLAHIRDLCMTVFDPAYLESWLNHYGAVVGQPYSTSLPWITARRNFALSQLPATAPFAITTNGGADFSVNAHSTTLTGTGWLDIHEIRRAGSALPLEVRWTNSTTWEVTLPLSPGANPVTLEAVSSGGIVLNSLNITITDTLPTPTPRDFLRITEVHYHPANPSTPQELAVSLDDTDFEFVELQNIGTETLILDGVTFTQGIDFTFSNGTTLAGGASLVVVKNVAAFTARYGATATIAGIYPLKKLSNSSDTITLVDATGQVIQTFTYDDAWAPLSDGAGRSLVVRNPTAAINEWQSPSHWALSTAIGGSPGMTTGSLLGEEFSLWQHRHFTPTELVSSTISGPNADPSKSGVDHFMRYALGLNPTQSPHAAMPTASIIGGMLKLEFRRMKQALDLNYLVETCSNLGDWDPVAVSPTQVSDNGDGTETVRVETSATAERKFIRLRVETKP